MSITVQSALLVSVAVALIAGCSKQVPANSQPGAAQYVRYQEITLSDGTRCVIADYHGTGVDCEWRAQGVER